MVYSNDSLIISELHKEIEAIRHSLSHVMGDPLRDILALCNTTLTEPKDTLSTIKTIRYLTTGLLENINQLNQYIFLNVDNTVQNLMDCNQIISEIKIKLADKIATTHAHITTTLLPSIHANKEELEQVFFAIIHNALTFCDTQPNIHISLKEEADHYLFSIQDNGIGIDPLYRHIVFAPFQIINPEDPRSGKGMGLAFAQKIIHKYNGNIWFEYEEDKGTIFYFTFPKESKK